jgi:hypothetical protein
VSVCFIAGENHWPATNHGQTLSHNVVSSTPRLELSICFIAGENHWPATNHGQTLSHNVVLSTPRLELSILSFSLTYLIVENILIMFQTMQGQFRSYDHHHDGSVYMFSYYTNVLIIWACVHVESDIWGGSTRVYLK